MQPGGSGVPGRRVRGQIADPGGGFLVQSGFGHAQILATDRSGRQSWGERTADYWRAPEISSS